MATERIEQLRGLMRERNIDLYIVPTADYHQSEYVGEYFKVREYLSGFSGSAGVLVVTKEEAGLWTDGRYFIQAEAELDGSGIILFKSGEPGIPTVNEYVIEYMKKHSCFGFDGKTVSISEINEIMEKLEGKSVKVCYEEDLAGMIWKQRSELAGNEIYSLKDKYAGESTESKLKRLRKKMEEKKASVHILTSLDDIAWLFNLRGSDVECNPVFLAYAVITMEQVNLFLNQKALSASLKLELSAAEIRLKDYKEIYAFILQMQGEEVILLDDKKVNYSLYKNISKKSRIIFDINPTTLLKAVKNQVEIANTKKAHILDGAAVTKFMYWLKNEIGKQEITEISAADYLENCRKEAEDFIGPSFPTISAYNANAAMMHYSPSGAVPVPLRAAGLLLVDSGGQYLTGTTDITRTFVLGDITEEQKKHYTAVVCGMLRLLNAKFLYGCSGWNLDILARGAVWDLEIDYKCGTGHGIGHVLNVHEGPNSFRWKRYESMYNDWIFEEGMITTNEPGIYIEGSHGIRIENELLCKKAVQNEWGQFMEFESLTFAPIDLDGINQEYMSERDIVYLNQYHEAVYKTISPYLNEKEQNWLKDYTKKI